MGDNQSFLALDWVKGEIEETLKQARQALEAFVENSEDGTQMRFCLAYLHQVLGTLQMVEFYGAALLAEEMEKLCLALIDGKVARVADGQEVLMRAILQLPPYLERVKASRRDLPVVLLPLLNDLRAVRGEPLMSETALFTPDLSAGERAPIQVAPENIDPALLKKIRQAYQMALLGIIRNDAVADNLLRMQQVFARLEKIAGASAIRELWLIGAALVEGVAEKSIDLGTSVKMLLGQIDRQLRTAGDSQHQKAPVDLLKNLLYYIARSAGTTARVRSIKDLYRLDDALPGEAMVNEERARMSGPDRDAMKSVVDALCEELARVKDALDIFVRKAESDRALTDLSAMIPTLKQVADTVAVLGLGQPRRILQEQIDVIDGITASGNQPNDGTLLDIAGALLYVEATLMGMVAEKPMGQPAANPASEFSAQDQLSEAQAAVLRESRSALEKAKDAVIEYIASQWNPAHLQIIPELVDTVRGSLAILSLKRPADILVRASRYVTERLLAGEHRPDWQEMDTLADVITSVEYYLERVANDAHGGDNILDIAERGLSKLGYGEVAVVSTEITGADEVDAEHDEAAFEAELAESQAVPDEDFLIETSEEEVLLPEASGIDETSMRPAFNAEIAEPAADNFSFDDLVVEPTTDTSVTAEQSIFETELSTSELSEEFSLEAMEAELGLEPMADVDLSFSVDAPVTEVTSSLDDFAASNTEFDLGDGSVELAIESSDEIAGFAEASFEGEPVEVAAEIEEAAPVAEVAVEPIQVAVTEVAAAAPKKPVLPVLTSMPQDDFDFDEEIREIFVEEAEEVMQAIGEYFPKWAANFDDVESLLEFRRGFHTLKGSGRMVGAKVVGELAWAIENMLNKVRDKILAPDQVMVNLVSETLALIPDLVEDFAQKVAPRYNTSALMAAADTLSRGDTLSAVDVAHAAEQAQGLAEAEVDNSADFDALAASLSADIAADAPRESSATSTVDAMLDSAFSTELSAEELAAADEALSLDFASNDEAASFDLSNEFSLPESVESEPLEETLVQVETQPEVESAKLEALPADAALETEVSSEPEVDLALLEIFTSEAESHLEIIADYLNAIDPERNTAAISDEVLRSLHTLKGSAGMAGIQPVAELAAPLEHLFKDLRNQLGHAKRIHLDALRDSHGLINASIADLQYGGKGRVEGLWQMIAHIRQLDQERLALLEKQQNEKLDKSAAVNVTAATKGLVASFMELGLDHVLDAPWELGGWLQGHQSNQKIEAIQQELQQLQAAATEKELTPLAILCERLQAVYARVAALELAIDDELLADLSNAHDEIINVFDTLAASQTVQPNEPVLSRLLDLLETPQHVSAPAIDDEPAVVAFESEQHQQGLADQMTDEPAGSAAWQEAEEVRHVDPVDPELLEIFLEEADEVLEAAQEEFDRWRSDADNTPALAALQRHLHTLKGGARLAEIRALGDLSHEMEFLYEGLVDGRYPSTPELVQLLQNCHDRLADMVAELRDGGSCSSGMTLVNAINAYRRNPGAGVALDAAAESPAAVAEPTIETATEIESPMPIETAADWAMDTLVVEPSTPSDSSEVELGDTNLFAEANLQEIEEVNESLDAVQFENAETEFTENPLDSVEIALEPELESPEVAIETASESLTEISFAADDVSTEALASEEVEVDPSHVAKEHHDAVFAEFFPDVDHSEPVPTTFAAPATTAASAPVEDHGFDPELLEIFMEEAGEIIDDTSEQLAAWKNNPDNILPVQQLQRGLHTLKGGARMAEITALGDLAHYLENLYEGVCDGLMTPTPVLFNLLHRCHDRLAEAIDSLSKQQGCPTTADLVEQIKSYSADPHNFQETPSVVTLTPVLSESPELNELAEVAPAPMAAPVAPLAPIAIEAADVPENVDDDILEIFLEESEELAEGIEASLAEWLDNRDASAPMEALLRHLHTLKGGARLAGLKALGNLAHDWETDLVAIQNGARKADDAFFDSLSARQDAVLDSIKALHQGAAKEDAPTEQAPVDEQSIAALMPVSAAPVIEIKPAAPTAIDRPRATPPSMQGGFKKDASARGPQEMIRVSSDLLEKLVNLAGETSITRSRVEMGVHGFAQTVEEMGSTIQRLADQLRRMDSEMETQIVARHNEETGGKYEDFDPLEMDQYSSLNQLSKALAESASDLLDLKSTLLDKARDTETLLLQQSRINTELQEGLMHSRMVPFSRLVPRLKRIVRQIGQEVGKPADLDVINPEGEMDRTLLERIVAPLEHMLRNAVDHGLEDQAGRAAAGKPAQGAVTLTLSREGGEVVLVLQDDGRGINVDAVRKKALERGLIKEGEDIPDQEVIQFIFHAGFSTAAAVTQISGRGVGMDVVQSEIKQMGGVVAINSVAGKGTTFTIRLPFTVAVNRALMVRVGEDSYAIPLSQIEGIVRASPYELETYYAPNAPLFEYAGISYRLSYLGEFVHDTKSPNLVGNTLPLPVLLIRGGDQHIAIQVDQLVGSREIVVKAVGAQLAAVAGISGATILGDGSVVIILDVTAMLRAAAMARPRAQALPDMAAVPTAPEVVSDARRTRTVMVVDDSVTVRKVTSRLLERHGYDVLLAKDGMDAITKLEDARPDIMLLDIEMPRMDGFEVASLVRHNPNLEDLPIIMITSRTGEKHRERAFQIGVNAYMGKPFQEEQLLGTIAELLAAQAVR